MSTRANGGSNGRRRRGGAAEVVDSSDDTVDLGTAHAAPSGTTLALREMTEETRDDSVSTATQPGGGRPPGSDKINFKELLRESLDVSAVRRTPYGLTPLAIVASTLFMFGIHYSAFRIAGPEIARDLEINVDQIIGVTITVGFFAALATLYVGWWADRNPRVPLVAAGTFISGIFSIVTSRAGSSLSLGAPRVVGEMGEAASSVPIFSLVADYYPVEVRGRVFAFFGMLSRIGRLFSIFIIGGLVVTVGWRPTFLGIGVVLMILGVVIAVRLREPVRGYMERRAVGADDDVARTEDEPQSFGEAWRATWSIRTLRRYFISDIFINFSDLLQVIFVPFFLADRYGLSALERGYLLIPSLLAGLVGGVIGGGLIDRFIRRNPSRVLVLVGCYQLLGVITFIGYALEPPLWTLVIIAMPISFGGALIGPASSVIYTQVIPPAIRTQGLQVFNLAIIPSFILGSVVVGATFEAGGFDGVFLLAIPFVVIAAILSISAAGFFDLDMRSAMASSIANDEWRRAKASGQGKLLVCRDVCVSYGNVQVLFNVDFDVEEGEIIALLGTNGAGKSTLLRAISGTSEANHGAIVFDGRDITHMPSHEIAARGVIAMPGGRGVFPGLTVRENLLLANWMTDDPEEIARRMADVQEIFPILVDRADTQASALSGGEQQQLSLAQAFLAKPRLLMIDELSLGLSPAVVAQLLEIVREIRNRGVTVIVVEQSVNVALTLAEKAIFMEKGEIKFFGRTADLLARPDILRAVYVKGTGALTEGGSAGARRSERDQRALELGTARPVLEAAELVKRYGGITAVDHVSFTLREGEVLGLIGPNGAGKTTIFDLISGYQVPDSGIVRFEGVDITSLTPEERSRRKLIRRFQDARLFPSLTVFETLLVALEQQHEMKSTLLNASGLPQARRAERRLRVRADRLIDLLELGGYRDKFVKELSTGLRRIVDIACVLASEPRVLLLDEPSSGIAQREAEGLAPMLRRVRFETGCSILIIEHDMPLISSVSDELIALDRGAVVLRGSPEEVLNDDRVIESYLGTTEAAVNRSGRVK